MNPICRRALRPLSNVCAPHCVVIHNVAYDVTNFDHPGGRVFTTLCGGLDVTELFEMSHVDHARASSMLSSLPVVTHTQTPKRHDFTRYAALRARLLLLMPTRASRSASVETHVRVVTCAVAALCVHVVLVHTQTASVAWFVLCMCSAFFNTLLGAYGHNGVHRVQPHAMGLDWNGLSCFEWLSEHVISHHPFVNTERDHDSISLEPIFAWLPRRTGMFGHAQTSWVRHVVYTLSELIVSIQGTLVHATRWKAAAYGAPWWMTLAPLLFVIRFASHFLFQSPFHALLTFLATMTPAGYAFATLAHLSHDNVMEPSTSCVVESQLGNTRDIVLCGFTGEMTLFLDRQRAHHLFPTVDHRRFSHNFIALTRNMDPR